MVAAGEQDIADTAPLHEMVVAHNVVEADNPAAGQIGHYELTQNLNEANTGVDTGGSVDLVGKADL